MRPQATPDGIRYTYTYTYYQALFDAKFYARCVVSPGYSSGAGNGDPCSASYRGNYSHAVCGGAIGLPIVERELSYDHWIANRIDDATRTVAAHNSAPEKLENDPK